MKIFAELKTIAQSCALAFLLFSCSNDDIPALNTAKNDVDLTTLGTIKGNPIFSQLVKAIELTELSETLKSSEPYTLFAPNNDAFAAYLRTTPYTTINDVPKNLLKQIILNHIIKDITIAKDFKAGYVKTLATGASSTDNKLSMYVSIASGVVLNGVANVTYSYAPASNGIVHIVNRVIFLPTVVTHAQANPAFRTLVENLDRTVAPDLLRTLSDPGSFTVFAPTNDAFTSFNTELVPGGLAAVSLPNLTKVLQYHVVQGNILASSLREGQIVSTLETPQTFEIQLTGGPKIKDALNRITNVTATDVQCDNGVIHVVDRVLRPTL